jgi:hypothetical protein
VADRDLSLEPLPIRSREARQPVDLLDQQVRGSWAGLPVSQSTDFRCGENVAAMFAPA